MGSSCSSSRLTPSTNLLTALSAELECPICKEDNKPLKLLPCQHKLCQECIVNITEFDRLDCPECRRSHTIPAVGFPVCRLTSRLLEELQSQQAGNVMSKASGSQHISRTIPKRNFSHENLPTRPTGLKKLVVQSDKNFTCLAVSWREDGNLLCSMKQANNDVAKGIIQMWSVPTMESINVIELADGRVAWSAFLVGDHLITKTPVQTKGWTMMETHVGTESKPFNTLMKSINLHDEEAKFCHTHAVAGIVADLHVTMDRKLLSIYGVESSHMFGYVTAREMFEIDISVLDHPFGVNISSIDESLLVTDFKTGELRKYAMDGTESQGYGWNRHQRPVWKRTGLLQPTGVTSDKTGLIYVLSNSKNLIYQISSQQGQILRKLEHRCFSQIKGKGLLYDIAVMDDRIAVCGEGGLAILSLTK